MSPTTLRNRLIGTGMAAAIAAAGLAGVAATAGTGVASAADCKQTSSAKKSLMVDYNFEKTVRGTVAQGGVVKYALTLGTTGVGNPYVQAVTDLPPAALRNVKPTVKIQAFTLLSGVVGGGSFLGNMLEEHPIAPGDVQKSGDGWKVSHTGWAVFAGKAFTAEFSYQLPSSIRIGTDLQSGGAKFQATPQPPLGAVDLPNLTACTTVRAPNPGEAILGGLDATGLGSAEGQLSSTGSLNDLLPGIIGGVIGGMGDDKDK